MEKNFQEILLRWKESSPGISWRALQDWLTVRLGKSAPVRHWLTDKRLPEWFAGGWPALVANLADCPGQSSESALLLESLRPARGAPEFQANKKAPNVAEPKPEEQTKPSHATVSPQRGTRPSWQREVDSIESSTRSAEQEVGCAEEAARFTGTLNEVQQASGEAFRRHRTAEGGLEITSESLACQRLEVEKFERRLAELRESSARPSQVLDYTERLRQERLILGAREKLAFVTAKAVLRWAAALETLEALNDRLSSEALANL